VWKAYVVLAVAAGLGAHVLGLSVPWSVAVGAVAPALPTFLLGVLRGTRIPAASEEPATAKQAMSGIEFEDHVARIARASGAPVMMTPLTGDFGVDLVVVPPACDAAMHPLEVVGVALLGHGRVARVLVLPS